MNNEMKIIMRGSRLLLLILLLFSFSTNLTAFAEETGDGTAAGEAVSEEKETGFEPDEERWVLNELTNGNIWNYKDCLVFIPAECNEDTTCSVYFGGGTGGWVLRNDLTYMYLKYLTPNVVSIWYKNSGIYQMPERVERTAQLLEDLEKETGVDTGKISITSSSNGCYTAIYAASHLISDFGIEVDTVVLLDMGADWLKTEYIITEEEAQPLIDMGTTVYHFGRSNDKLLSHPGAKQFSDYGVRFVDVKSIDRDHDRISRHAYKYGVFSWAAGETDQLREDYYTFVPVNF